MKRWSATCLAVGLIGLALPAGASAGCVSVHPKLRVGGLHLTAAERSAITIRRVCTTRAPKALEVDITFAGDFEHLIGAGHLAKAVIGIVAYRPPPRARRRPKHSKRSTASAVASRAKKRKKKRAKQQLAYAAGTAGPAGRVRTLSTKLTGVAVLRRGATLTFYLAGPALQSTSRINVRVAVPRPKQHRARKTDSTPLAGAGWFLGNEVELASDIHLRPPGVLKCPDLKAMMDRVQAEIARLTAAVEAQAKAGRRAEDHELDDLASLDKWLREAKAYYRDCPPPIVPVPPGVFPVGSDLTHDANFYVRLAQDWAAWIKKKYGLTAARDAAGPSLTAPVDGQVLSFKVKGRVNPSGMAGDPGPLTAIHLQDLVPQADGSVRVDHSSQQFNIPSTGDPNQINEFKPENFCVRKGDYIGFNSEGGFDPTFYPDGVPFQVFSSPQPGWTLDIYSKHNGTGNGAQFTGTEHPGVELLMQAIVGTGSAATALCPGGTGK
jgi:hypothetical protein